MLRYRGLNNACDKMIPVSYRINSGAAIANCDTTSGEDGELLFSPLPECSSSWPDSESSPEPPEPEE
jgi:hypothetical protein